MTFPAYRLPPEVEVGMQGGPTFYNYIQTANSGKEQRVRVRNKCRWRWTLGYSILNYEETAGTFQAVNALFIAHIGSLYPFRFKPHGDSTLTNELIGTGDGSETEFQITKTYDPGTLLGASPLRTYVREIYFPYSGLVVKVNNVAQTLTTHYTISSTGLITFLTPPTNGHTVKVTGEYDVPVRFDLGPDEPLPMTINEAGLAQIEPFPIIELIGTEELA
jgi:uncharacterized protein (TIGR02217 family)